MDDLVRHYSRGVKRGIWMNLASLALMNAAVFVDLLPRACGSRR